MKSKNQLITIKLYNALKKDFYKFNIKKISENLFIIDIKNVKIVLFYDHSKCTLSTNIFSKSISYENSTIKISNMIYENIVLIIK